MDNISSDQPTGSGLLSGPCREKYWSELDDAGKIARLHEVVKRLERQVASLTKTANDAHRIAESHEHGATGVVMMPVDSFNRNEGAEVGRQRDPKWF